MIQYNQSPTDYLKTEEYNIACFNENNENIDLKVVEAFGDEWLKFNNFEHKEIEKLGKLYFDILDDAMINKKSIVLDAGCGSGRFTHYLANRAGFVEAIDPSLAVLAASKLLSNTPNVRISKASISNIPFDNNSFDLVMSIGVLHHIPNTLQAMKSCVQKVKSGGYFYTYLYYALDNRGVFFKLLFHSSNLIRRVISKLPSTLKKILCDLLAILLYMPIVYLGRFFRKIGLEKWAVKLPLSFYQDKNFMIIRNDSLDRFGTSLEQRFSKQQIIEMMQSCGLKDINVSEGLPYWHAVGKKTE